MKKPIIDYDEEYDIYYQHFGNKTVHSRELKNVNIVVDFDKDDNIVGIEIFDFMKAIKKGDEELERLFKKATQKK